MTMKRITQAALVALAAATATLAQAEATNPAVKARQEAMEAIGDNMKVLSAMAKGERAFDAAAAGAATAAIAERAGAAPALFEAEETDPESEAKPEIWKNFGDFSDKAGALKTAAAGADVTSLEALQASLMKVGGTCKSCHDDYRIKK